MYYILSALLVALTLFLLYVTYCLGCTKRRRPAMWPYITLATIIILNIFSSTVLYGTHALKSYNSGYELGFENGLGKLKFITTTKEGGYHAEYDIEASEPIETHYEFLGTFTCTAYCACEQCCGKWASGYTATGTKATAGRTVAVDPSVIPLGTTIEVGSNRYVAEDTGSLVTGNRIDIFFDTHEEAVKFGVQKMDVYVVTFTGGSEVN